jgi:hypothetical protein
MESYSYSSLYLAYSFNPLVPIFPNFRAHAPKAGHATVRRALALGSHVAI